MTSEKHLWRGEERLTLCGRLVLDIHSNTIYDTRKNRTLFPNLCAACALLSMEYEPLTEEEALDLSIEDLKHSLGRFGRPTHLLLKNPDD